MNATTERCDELLKRSENQQKSKSREGQPATKERTQSKAVIQDSCSCVTSGSSLLIKSLDSLYEHLPSTIIRNDVAHNTTLTPVERGKQDQHASMLLQRLGVEGFIKFAGIVRENAIQLKIPESTVRNVRIQIPMRCQASGIPTPSWQVANGDKIVIFLEKMGPEYPK